MPRYEIRYRGKVKKELKKIPNPYRKRVVTKISKLAQNPWPVECEKLSGSKSSFRLRVGIYRIIYTVYQQKLIVSVIKVAHRKDAYRKF